MYCNRIVYSHRLCLPDVKPDIDDLNRELERRNNRPVEDNASTDEARTPSQNTPSSASPRERHADGILHFELGFTDLISTENTTLLDGFDLNRK